MRILTWNILAEEFIKKRDYQDISNDILFNRSMRCKKIITLLDTYKADIICLQEVMKKEYNGLYDVYHNVYHLIKSSPIKWSYSDSTYKSSSFNLTLIRKDSDLLVLKTYNLKFGNGVLIFLSDNGYNLPVLILNLHLSDDSSLKRIEQLYEIENLFSYPYIILAGDLNENYKPEHPSALYQYLQSFFKIHNYLPTYYHYEQSCIDNVLTKGLRTNGSKILKVSTLNDQTTQQIYNYGSDHLPVIMDI